MSAAIEIVKSLHKATASQLSSQWQVALRNGHKSVSYGGMNLAVRKEFGNPIKRGMESLKRGASKPIDFLYTSKSDIAGNGVFTSRHIPKGTCVLLAIGDFDSLKEDSRLSQYGYPVHNIVTFDMTMYTVHDNRCNLIKYFNSSEMDAQGRKRSNANNVCASWVGGCMLIITCADIPEHTELLLPYRVVLHENSPLQNIGLRSSQLKSWPDLFTEYSNAEVTDSCTQTEAPQGAFDSCTQTEAPPGAFDSCTQTEAPQGAFDSCTQTEAPAFKEDLESDKKKIQTSLVMHDSTNHVIHSFHQRKRMFAAGLSTFDLTRTCKPEHKNRYADVKSDYDDFIRDLENNLAKGDAVCKAISGDLKTELATLSKELRSCQDVEELEKVRKKTDRWKTKLSEKLAELYRVLHGTGELLISADKYRRMMMKMWAVESNVTTLDHVPRCPEYAVLGMDDLCLDHNCFLSIVFNLEKMLKLTDKWVDRKWATTAVNMFEENVAFVTSLRTWSAPPNASEYEELRSRFTPVQARAEVDRLILTMLERLDERVCDDEEAPCSMNQALNVISYAILLAATEHDALADADHIIKWWAIHSASKENNGQSDRSPKRTLDDPDDGSVSKKARI
jgi:hypothetical protein